MSERGAVTAADRFTGKAETYRASRPGYPDALARWLEQRGVRGVQVADIGAGTGIFSRFLLALACTVYAVEPNAGMRAVAARELGGEPRFFLINGAAEETGLPDACVSLVAAAQAFHWFSPEGFRRECRRILRPGGAVLLVWNSRVAEDPAVRENAAVCRRFCPGFTGFSGGGPEGLAERIRSFFGGEPERLQIPYDLFYTKEKFLARNCSASYSLREEHPQFREYLAALEALFDAHAENGLLRVPNVTAAYWGRLKEDS